MCLDNPVTESRGPFQRNLAQCHVSYNELYSEAGYYETYCLKPPAKLAAPFPQSKHISGALGHAGNKT